MKQFSKIMRISSWVLLLVAVVLFIMGYKNQTMIVMATAVLCSAVVVSLQVANWYRQYTRKGEGEDN